MEIYKNNGTGIFTGQQRECNVFGFFDLNVEFYYQRFTFRVYLWELENDALEGKRPNNIRNITIPITTEETLDACIATLFAGSPYTLTGETLNLSNAEIIGKYP